MFRTILNWLFPKPVVPEIPVEPLHEMNPEIEAIFAAMEKTGHDVLLVNPREDGGLDIVETLTFDEFAARGRLPDCNCRLIQCVCAQARGHKKGCFHRLAMTCPVAFACEDHGDEVCPVCYACTCSDLP